MQAGDACLLCGGGPLLPVLSIPGVPALCNALYGDAALARRAPRGPVDLRICPSCGGARNVAFDPALVTYSAEYENSLHFSPSFQSFAVGLAERLAAAYGLAGGTVLEIGCGKGEFLGLLCEVAGCTGVGYDPTYEGGAADGPFTVERTTFPTAPGQLSAGLVVCRHVLEHLDDPRAVLTTLRTALGEGSTTPAYFEVPDGSYMFAAPALWDVIYEHPWYYTAPALRHLFGSCGFAVTATSPTFGGQYLSVDVRAAAGGTAPAVPGHEVVAVVDAATRFGRSFDDAVARWSDELSRRAAAGQPVVLWGAGSKGVTFLNVVPEAAGDVVAAIDVNPRKHGRYVAGSGHRIIGPAELAGVDPAVVVVMNPMYRDEIAGQLEAAGVRASVEVA